VLTAIGATLSLVLIALQPLVARAWCGPCLMAGAISIVLAAGSAAEWRARLRQSTHSHGTEAIGS
jgi:hypothetical protein